MDNHSAGPERPPGSKDSGPPAVFEQVGLTVQLTADRGSVFLDVRSRLDPAQGLLLPTGHRPAISGVSLFTRLGRLHARYWALVYGLGTPAAAASVQFQASALRYRRSTTTVPRPLGAACWVAAAEGTFEVATLFAKGTEIAHTALSHLW